MSRAGPPWALRALLGGAVGLSLLLSGALVWSLGGGREAGPGAEDGPSLAPVAAGRVSALGRLEPRGRVLRLGAPLPLVHDRVDSVEVVEGQPVRTGQPLALLDSHRRLEQASREAESRVRLARARLAQVQAGARRGELEAQQARIQSARVSLAAEVAAQTQEVARLEARSDRELAAQRAALEGARAAADQAEAELRRSRGLFAQGALPAADLELRERDGRASQARVAETQAVLERIERTGRREVAAARAVWDRVRGTGEAALDEARARHRALAEVRGVDLEAAQAELAAAEAAAGRARADWEEARICAPCDGFVLKIHSRAGEQVRPEGLLELAGSREMEAVAEVYQTDLSRIRVGQPARIRAAALPVELKGAVTQVGRVVEQQTVLADRPGENLDRRIVEVRVGLSPEDSARVAALTWLQVDVVFLP